MLELGLPVEYWLPCTACNQKGHVVRMYSNDGHHKRYILRECMVCDGRGWVKHIEAIKLIGENDEN